MTKSVVLPQLDLGILSKETQPRMPDSSMKRARWHQGERREDQTAPRPNNEMTPLPEYARLPWALLWKQFYNEIETL